MSSFFSSGLAMWSPALSDADRSCTVKTVATSTAALSSTPTATVFPYFQYHHEPVYDPPTCAVCGLPHRARRLNLEMLRDLNDQSTLSSASCPSYDPDEREIIADKKNHLSIIVGDCPPRRGKLGCFGCIRLVLRCVRACWRRVFPRRKAVYPSRTRRSKAI